MLRIHAVTEQDAREFASWTYPEPYSLYNSSPDAFEHFLDPSNGYLALEDRGLVVAYCCFGEEARVPGGNYEDDAVDIGVGMRPDLTGKGRGKELLETAITEASRRFPGLPLRVTIATFNERARHLAGSLGLDETERFKGPQRRDYVVLVRRPS